MDPASGSEISIAPRSPTSAVARELIDELSAHLEAVYGSSGRQGYVPADERDGLFLVAFVGSEPVGCGAIRPLPEHAGVAEVKRMYSRPHTTGVGRAILTGLEAHAARHGFTAVWLETRRANGRAVRFYRRAGYTERAAYGRYIGRPEAICMEKNWPRPVR